MFQLFRAKDPLIGLDVGSESIKILQLAESAGGLKVHAAVRVSIPDDVIGDPDKRLAFTGETVRAALRGRRFQGWRVAAALPKELVHYKTHRLPPMQAEDVDVAAKIDARDLFRFDPNRTAVQVLDAGEVLPTGTEHQREVILVAAGKPHVDELVRTLHRSGARVESLDIEPCAIWHAASGLVADETVPRIIIDIGTAQSRLLIGRGDVIQLIKLIAIGSNDIRTAITRKLGLSSAEADKLRRRAKKAGADEPDKLQSIRKMLGEATRHVCDRFANEASAGIRHYVETFGGPAASSIELVGGESSDPQIRSALAATLKLSATPLNVFRGVDISAIPSDDRTPALGEWAVALGLALKSFPNVRRVSTTANSNNSTSPIPEEGEVETPAEAKP